MSYSQNELEEIYNSNNSKVDACDPSSLVTLVRDEFSQYKNTVASFFTDKANEIRFIYDSIRSNAFPYNRMMLADSNKAMHLYLEYFEGMQKYLDRVFNLKSTDEVDSAKLSVNITSMIARDHDFVDSIYSEETNPKEENDLNSAMLNVEVLIDVYNGADAYYHLLGTYADKLASVDPLYKDQCILAMKLMAHSVRHFHKDIIKEILGCYDIIHDSIQRRTPVGGEPKPVDPYQVF